MFFSEISRPKAEVFTAIGEAVESEMPLYFNTRQAKIIPVPVAPVPVTEKEAYLLNDCVRTMRTKKPGTAPKRTKCRSKVMLVCLSVRPGKAKLKCIIKKNYTMSANNLIIQ